MSASHSSPGQQLLDKLQTVSPVALDGEVVVLSLMFVFPAALYYAGRVLIWDYKVSSFYLGALHLSLCCMSYG